MKKKKKKKEEEKEEEEADVISVENRELTEVPLKLEQAILCL